MTLRPRSQRVAALSAALFLFFHEPVFAYIGPGAGFVFVSSFLALFVSFFLAFLYLISWPARSLLKSLFKKKRVESRAAPQRVIVLGLDGFDPKLVDQYMAAGKLPHFEQLKNSGTFVPLATSYPSISPVAWSSFATGTDASYHNIFDFLTRDPCTYAPTLSSVEIQKAAKSLPLGKYRIALSKPKIQGKRKSRTFWSILGEYGVFNSVLRVPITYPPEKFDGVLLSGMCTPDLQGTQGTFSYFTSNLPQVSETTGGIRHTVSGDGNRWRGVLTGPESPFTKSHETLHLNFTARPDELKGSALLEVCEHHIDLRLNEYSAWIRLTFSAGLGTKIYGICRFYLISLSPHFELYVSPIHIDPERPALPISHPFIYSVYLAKLNGLYGTLGLAEDTWALNEEVLDEKAFLKQAYLFHEEREKMFLSALDRTPKGVTTCVFDAPDRVQHMFFRCLDESHPANRGKKVQEYRTVIQEMYQQMDSLLGKVLSRVDDRTVLIVMSDHGFTHFKRGVNLNTWLFQNGYLSLEAGRTVTGDWFEGVDWKTTRAFALGLSGIFINRKGRESHGAVSEGKELESLKKELVRKLNGLQDEATGQTAIVEVIDTEGTFRGPYLDDAPDLLVGYNHGYRNSWSCATGRVTETVFDDNTRHWSGDHCVSPQLVPGVLFINRKIKTSAPKIVDIAPTILTLFGVKPPSHMQGSALI